MSYSNPSGVRALGYWSSFCKSWYTPTVQQAYNRIDTYLSETSRGHVSNQTHSSTSKEDPKDISSLISTSGAFSELGSCCLFSQSSTGPGLPSPTP